MAKKPINFLLFKAKKGVKEANSLLSKSESSLQFWSKLRKNLNKSGMMSQQDAFRKALGLPATETGAKGKALKSSLKKSRKNLAGQIPTQSKEVDSIDRIVNARGKGIKFIKKNGRIIPIRIKE